MITAVQLRTCDEINMLLSSHALAMRRVYKPCTLAWSSVSFRQIRQRPGSTSIESPLVEASTPEQTDHSAEQPGLSLSERWELTRLNWTLTGEANLSGNLREKREKVALLKASTKQRNSGRKYNLLAIMAKLRITNQRFEFTEPLPLHILVAIHEEMWLEDGVRPM